MQKEVDLEMSLRYGIPKVEPSRRICFNCQHFCVSIDPHQGWGVCDIAKNDGLFVNHTSHGRYVARHTNSRYYTQKGCKVRFKEIKED